MWKKSYDPSESFEYDELVLKKYLLLLVVLKTVVLYNIPPGNYAKHFI